MSTPSQTHGAFSWMELHCADGAKAQAFYSDLLGWGTRTVDVGVGPYTMIMNNENMIGGFPSMETESPRWLPYVTVDSVDARVEKARALGATIAMEPMSIPNVGRMATIVDPLGGVIAMITYEEPTDA
ncbi:VOC family protein [Roseibium aggregatum]|uniref:27 kDa antigen Cfp30B n=1 Tax=Roseibium aggregatum TaxID=187304 RepID=A0A0M6Y4X4_9HYPH|nr:VOC family protein [Roseibium aggregatum]CTQ44754.1 27 kDa antigen Cfp30B [Roseibium aggregatum]